MTKTIGEKILELRKARSLTQEKLGEQLGISSQAVSKWENGDSMPDIMVLPQLCEILGISIDALLEVPQSMKKENIMKSFRDYANEVGKAKALHEAFCYSNSNEALVGTSINISSKWIEVAVSSGMGFVISNKDFLDKIKDFDVQAITEFFKIYSDENNMTVIKELSYDDLLTKEELMEKCNLSLESINSILLTMMEAGVCDYRYNKLINKHGYILSGNSYILSMLLTAYFMVNPIADRGSNTSLTVGHGF